MPKYTEMNLATGAKTELSVDETKDFKGRGGEKSIYVKGQLALGVYHDPKCVMPEAKCAELSVLTHPGIIKPHGLLYKSSKRVGETMLAVQDPWVLTSLFTMTFRKKHGLDERKIAAITKIMNLIVEDAHKHDIFIVDNNENNWLLSNDFKSVFAIDTGNWQTPSFPSTMIMLNIKDPFNKPGSGADWYAHAILLANLYIGKHPFECDHPKYMSLLKATIDNGINRRPRMEAMMQDRVSFFRPECALNRACYPLDSIPAALRRWIQSTLESDVRVPPPVDFEIVAAVRKTDVLNSSAKFDIVRLFTAVGDIISVSKPNLKRTILTTQKWFIDNQAHDYPKGVSPADVVVAYTNKDNPILAWVESGRLCLRDSGLNSFDRTVINASSVVSTTDGRLIAISNSQALEVELIDLRGDGTVTVRTKQVGQVVDMPNATRAFPGCIIQNMLGSWRCSTFPIPGRCVMTRLIDCEGGQIVDAKYDNGALMVLSEKKGVYSRYLYFAGHNDELKLVITDGNCTSEGLNFTVNGRGTFTQIVRDGLLEGLRLDDPTKLSVFSDPMISTDMTLSAEGLNTHFFRGNELYSLKVKQVKP